ncbi:hypothetical protein N7532_003503 [Penicillium argentinense]|uniref:Apple domain-containing protein n=1 Tax=Penicillium argentinense TaxID=1131581 RepID=A0A9W9KE29_9EURO|nr:uncharacterized protein N7532_003503 [Penicillium argentinense]KAJ5102974.1 hypothetical protein N7532_003503 [Penicillium argentinense]
MRTIPTTLAGLALLYGLANAQSAYDSTCNPAPAGDQDIEPGVVATYGCGEIHNAGDYANEQSTVATPEECATECAKRTPEGPCSWHGGTCYFYNAGAGAAAWPNAVTIVTRKDWDKLKVAYDQCGTKLTACQAATVPGGATGGGGPPGGGGGGGGPPVGIPKRKICEHNTHLDKQTISSDGRTYKIWCNAIKHGPNDLGEGIKVKSIDECIELCNKKVSPKKCVRAITNNAGTSCYLRSHGNNLTPDAPGYISAHLV